MPLPPLKAPGGVDLERLLASYAQEIYAAAIREAIAADTRPEAEQLDGTIVVSEAVAARWRFVASMSYDQLPDEEQAHYKHHANVMLTVLRALCPSVCES